MKRSRPCAHPSGRALVVLLLTALLAAACALGAQPERTPIVILVSFDGWRWDYLDRAEAPHLSALAARGARAEGLIPAYPPSTFPNHYTIVTGLAPGSHGIVSNTIVDRTIGPERFTMAADTARDPRWWGGEPIWSTAMRSGRRAASMFWPGSEAVHPTYWRPFDGALPHEARVAQVLEWLRLPEAERPSFITIYFSAVDTAAHRFGPDSPEALEAAASVDRSLGALVDGVAGLGLGDRTSFVVVSDHGLAQTSTARFVYLDDYLDPGTIEIVDLGAVLGLNPRGGGTVEALIEQLEGRHPSLAVYRREDAPAWLRYGHERVPAVIGLVEPGWTVLARRPDQPPPTPPRIGGAHGYDPRYRDMHGLFVAAGPRVRQGVVAPAFENIHVYEFLCALLGLAPAPNDGNLQQTAGMMRKP